MAKSRAHTLVKKSWELETLCSAQVCLLCFTPAGQFYSWPEKPQQLRSVLNRYQHALSSPPTKPSDSKKRKREADHGSINAAADSGTCSDTESLLRCLESRIERLNHRINAVSSPATKPSKKKMKLSTGSCLNFCSGDGFLEEQRPIDGNHATTATWSCSDPTHNGFEQEWSGDEQQGPINGDLVTGSCSLEWLDSWSELSMAEATKSCLNFCSGDGFLEDDHETTATGLCSDPTDNGFLEQRPIDVTATSGSCSDNGLEWLESWMNDFQSSGEEWHIDPVLQSGEQEWHFNSESKAELELELELGGFWYNLDDENNLLLY